MTTRRQFLRVTGKVATGAGLASLGNNRTPASIHIAAQSLAAMPPEETARDEDFWFAVQQADSLVTRYIILNAGASNPSPRIVRNVPCSLSFA